MDNLSFTIAQALSWATEQLSSHNVSDDGLYNSSVIDSKVLLAACLQREVVYLHTWPERLLDAIQIKLFQEYISQRSLGHPVAHIIGYRDFWSLRLKVSPATLIPRPETELLIEIVLNLTLGADSKVLDLGTGTGAIALALATENPHWLVTGIDKSSQAVALATDNASMHQLERVKFIQSDWFAAVEHRQFDLIVTNPPYIEDNNHYLQQGDVRFEPSSALTSGEDGLDDIRSIVSQSKSFLTDSGWLVIEHGYQQSRQVTDILRAHGFNQIRSELDLNGLPRVTIGCK
ncbi:peptide chain release factor N(5)-glutamine methyltransferase [Paraglaciecola sp. MB-3u-78]|uniref:peptide chain release factor N(5)-glutamine methyltransferase n=1 Tax=Paraglaciecola sp. MB-3u-78 TaxID=2058332 RepID=UPI000C3337CE|nr:peptide chain release factor N(5)-glutamine methyltransferase [Paraglaciecola sp. MB-3u-78]PKG99177.1 peptide chain release factor N(5)-glutamine methyltransferase [Paraglaciecola sp. MB-3u-78]